MEKVKEDGGVGEVGGGGESDRRIVDRGERE